MKYNKREVFADNILAIKIALSYRDTNNIPNQEEKTALAQYKGFGGLREVLFAPTDDFGVNVFLKPYVIELHELLDNYPNWKRLFMDSIKTSTLTAYYTPTALVDIIAKSINLYLEDEPITMLDPSAGVGIFSDRFKANGLNVEKYDQVELDVLTALINQVKNRGEIANNILNKGYEESKLQNESYNLIASNIPFANIPVYDAEYSRIKDKSSPRKKSQSMVHNYYFVKSLDLLAEGGLLAFITSAGTIKSDSNSFVRQFIIDNAAIIGSYKLPSSLFTANGINYVDTDLIILQKTAPKKGYTHFDSVFISNVRNDSDLPLSILNEFNANAFGTHRLEHSYSTNQYGKRIDVWDTDDYDAYYNALRGQINHDFKIYFNEHLFKKTNQTLPFLQSQNPVVSQPKTSILGNQSPLFGSGLFDNMVDATVKIKSYYRIGTLVNQSNSIYKISVIDKSTNSNDVTAKLELLPLNEVQKNTLSSAITIRDCFFDLLEYEKEYQIENEPLRAELNNLYDTHLTKHGNFNNFSNKVNVIDLDAIHCRQLYALEVLENNAIIKASIFREPTMITTRIDSEIISINVAISKSLNKYGNAQASYIKNLMRIDDIEFRRQTAELLYLNPITDELEIKEKILTGNLHEKIETFKRSSIIDESQSLEIQRSIDFLTQNLPEKLSLELIQINFGTRWLDTAYYEDFFSSYEVFKSITSVSYNPSLDSFRLGGLIRNDNFSVRTNNRYYDGHAVAESVMLDTMPEMTITQPDGSKIADKEGILRWNESSKRLKSAFQFWLKTYHNREVIVDKYNYLYNGYANVESDGQFLKFEDMNFKNLKIEDLYATQKNCVWKMLMNEGGLVDHEVGGGKTLIMCATAHEAKRMGVAKKPIILCMKANVDAIAETYRKAYPQDNLLALGEKDISKDNRAKLFAKLNSNNYDAVILTHDQFMDMPQSPEIIKDFYLSMIHKAEENLEEEKYGNLTKKDKVNLEKQIVNLKVKYAKAEDRIARQKDDIYNFKDFGFDFLIVDESHKFKNLVFNTRHTKIAGLGNIEGSDRASNMMFACRSIQESRGSDSGIMFLSGTPISNSITELYNIFSYLRPSELEKLHLANFDSWVANYSSKTIDFEQNVASKLIQKERFRRFSNVPELSSFYRQMADVQNAQMIGIVRPEVDTKLVLVKQSEDGNAYTDNLLRFAETGNGAYIQRNLSDGQIKAKMLMVTNLSKAQSLDLRMVLPNIEPFEESKLFICAKSVAEFYHKSMQDKGTQLIFSDTGVGSTDWGFNGYKEFKRILIEKYNIPSNEIAIAQDFNSKNQKTELHKKVREGAVRIFIGSTETMGTGVNVQDKIVAMHHIDIPWRPSDMEQRIGRGMRTGNLLVEKYGNGRLMNFIYATDRTLDSYKFMLLDLKSTFINQIKNNSTSVRFVDEGAGDENNGMNYKEFQAIVSGSGEMLKLARYEKEYRNLEESKELHYKINNQNTNYYHALVRDKTKLEQFQKNTIIDRECFEKLLTDGTINICYQNEIYTDEKKLGAKIIEDNEKIYSEKTIIGNIGDFLINVEPRNYLSTFTDKNSIFSDTKYNHYSLSRPSENAFGVAYTHNNGDIHTIVPLTAGTHFMKALGKVPGIYDDYLVRLSQITNDIKEIGERLDRPFPEEDKILDLQVKLDQTKQIIAIEMEQQSLALNNDKPNKSLGPKM